jgi:hypothetical protein
MPPATASSRGYRPEEMTYPSRTIAFQAAGMITSIVEKLQTHHEIRYTPAFIVYSLFSALIMHVYQMRSSVPSVVATCQERISTCMQALKDVSKVWLVAKMVYTLFDSIIGNKILEERLQKAPGKRHQTTRVDSNNNHNAPAKKADPPKRKYDDMEFGLPNGGPTPAVSYERSRPQTPAATPSRELGHPPMQTSVGTLQTSPNAPSKAAQDAFQGPGPSRGNTRPNTRPTTPFNPTFSLPATPPDLFLVTRNSPNLSPTLWENFQPDQLFPDGTNFFPSFSSPQANTVDPQMQMPTHMQGQNVSQQPIMVSQGLSSHNASGNQGNPLLAAPPELGAMRNPHQSQHMFGMENQQSWHGLDAALGGNAMDGSSQDDSWSTSSRGHGPTAPTTLNVEDWYGIFQIRTVGRHGNFTDMPPAGSNSSASMAALGILLPIL